MEEKLHWSARLHDALEAKQQPGYDLLEEAVHALLQERASYLELIKDISQKMAGIVVARISGDNDLVLAKVDAVIASNVVMMNGGTNAAAH